MILSDLQHRFQGHDIIQRQIVGKTVQCRAMLTYNSGPIESHIWFIEGAIFNDHEQPLTQFARSRRFLTVNVL